MDIKRLTGIAVCIIILMILFMNGSCSSTNTTNNPYTQSIGSYKKSQEVYRLFKTYQYHPDYKYYYAGFMKDTEGVVGMRNDQLIEESCGRGSWAVHWHEFENTPQNLEILVKGIERKGKPYGADIFDNAGKQVGILYTFEQFEYRPSIRKSGDNFCIVPQYYFGSDWVKGD